MSEYTREEILRLIEENGGPYGLDLSGKDLSFVDLGRDAILAELEKARERTLDETHVWCSSFMRVGVNLEGANFQGAYLAGAHLQGAYLQGANLQEAFLGSVDLREAFLPGANLQNACLGHADLLEAQLGGANLQDADLRDANLQGAKYNNATKWPEGFTPPPEAVYVDAETNVED
jgi:uncharacterized protein YjbI with pentapeptide repeats